MVGGLVGWRTSDRSTQTVPHLRGGLIIAKVGIRAMREP
jgi:hypothetical protein